ncbi:hypothetical protein [Corynebacterium hindlerae]|uniref:hypothetical protein n=1 Tax=Corynebacterium hindlerae TaxID=699041 RepID=UPI0031B724AB
MVWFVYSIGLSDERSKMFTKSLRLTLPATALLAASLVACGSGKDFSPAPEIEARVTSSSEAPSEDAAHSISPQSTSTVAAPIQADAESITPDFVADALAKSMTPLEQPTNSIALTHVLAGAALEARENERQELEANELRQEGTAKVIHSEISPGQTPDTMHARLCVDSSDVKIFDKNNVLVNAHVPADEQRSALLASFEKIDGQWKLAELQFPSDPRC